MKRVLITGITGYIGSHLARALLADCEVHGLAREPLHTEYIADMQDKIHLRMVDGSYGSIYRALEEIRPEIVYHMAAYYTGAHGAETTPALVSSNITFGAYLLEAMAAHGVTPLVYATTIMAHYEGMEYRPLNLYAATKQALSDLLLYYTDAGLLRAVTLILSDTYGPSDYRPKVMNLIRNAVQEGKRISLSAGEQDYDVVYIDDVVRAFRQAGEQLVHRGGWKNETFQICAPQPLTLRQTVERMIEINHLTLDADWGGHPSPEREIRRAVRLHPTVPGWQVEVPLDEGLRLFYTGQEAVPPIVP